MVSTRIGRVMITLSALSLMLSASNGFASGSEKPKVLKPCMQCHAENDDNDIRGKLGSVSMKAETIKIDTGKASWLVSFDDDTSLDGAEAFNKIGKGKEILVTYREEDGMLFADSVAVKPPAKLDPSMLIKVEELAPLIEKGPKEGKFTIVDARPGKLFIGGHIPGAISIYDAQFEKNLDKLPTNKEDLLVFYCGGPT
ncbi:rhodanese-like domain-containing protein [Desulfopila sp. IMCC35008]|uniref:rhodanese-like domain-containing protein n=1 Tax=Desulfopila sp. IMCC35008 TaxID=2653858 RepID=UPI0013D4D90F|nr:rhodanese-like domain-containing protein [Desulfopila sp. IMCC35008]